MAWRKEAVGQTVRGEQEMALAFCRERIKEGSEHELVVARWPDGHEHTISGLTYGRLGEMMRVSHGASASQGPLWEGVHSQTNHKITVAQRVDRQLLVSVYEQSRQILQVKATAFGPIEDEHKQQPNENSTIQAALKFLEPIVINYCAGTLEKDEMKKERDRLLAELARTRPRSKKGVYKRPAAAQPMIPKSEPTTAPSSQACQEVLRRPAAATPMSPTSSQPLTRPSAATPTTRKKTKVENTESTTASGSTGGTESPAPTGPTVRNWKLRKHDGTPSRLPPVRDSALSVWTTGGLWQDLDRVL